MNPSRLSCLLPGGIQEGRKKMTEEQYKKYIVEMLEELNLMDLSRVYEIVHGKFIRRGLEAYERAN